MPRTIVECTIKCTAVADYDAEYLTDHDFMQTLADILKLTFDDVHIASYKVFPLDQNERRIDMATLNAVKNIIKENIEFADGGIFNTRNVLGDPMETIYENNGVCVDMCRYEYFEVFGLSEEDFAELEKFYEDVRDEYRARLYAEWQSDDDEEDEDEPGTEIA